MRKSKLRGALVSLYWVVAITCIFTGLALAPVNSANAQTATASYFNYCPNYTNMCSTRWCFFGACLYNGGPTGGVCGCY